MNVAIAAATPSLRPQGPSESGVTLFSFLVAVIALGAYGGRFARVPDSLEIQSSYPPSRKGHRSGVCAVVVWADEHHVVQRIIAATAQPMHMVCFTEFLLV